MMSSPTATIGDQVERVCPSSLEIEQANIAIACHSAPILPLAQPLLHPRAQGEF